MLFVIGYVLYVGHSEKTRASSAGRDNQKRKLEEPILLRSLLQSSLIKLV